MSKTIIEFIQHNLVIPNGRNVGEPFTLLPFQRRFIMEAMKAGSHSSVLSCGRGNAKTTLSAALAVAFISTEERKQVVLASVDLDSARECYNQARQISDDADLDIKWRPSYREAQDNKTGSTIRILSSDKAKGLSIRPSLVIADELAAWKESSPLLGLLKTAVGKTEGGKIIAISTRGQYGAGNQLERFIASAQVKHIYSADAKTDPYSMKALKEANPGLGQILPLENIKRAQQEAKGSPVDLRFFKGQYLNQPTDIGENDEPLVEFNEWQKCLISDEELDVSGASIIGLDLGGSKSFTAVCFYNEENGHIDATAFVGKEPNLLERGEDDGVGDLYVRMEERGELIRSGNLITNMAEVLDYIADRAPDGSVLVGDRYRDAEFKEMLHNNRQHNFNYIARGVGTKDGSASIRALRRAVYQRKIKHTPSILLETHLRNSIVKAVDMAGNPKLERRGQQARNDAAAALLMAVGYVAAKAPKSNYEFYTIGGNGGKGNWTL